MKWFVFWIGLAAGIIVAGLGLQIMGCREQPAPDPLEMKLAKALLADVPADQVDPLLPCVVTLARAPAVKRIHWDPPMACQGDTLAGPIVHYNVQARFQVPDTNLVIFVMGGRQLTVRVSGELSNGMTGCALGDTAWSAWMEVVP